MADHIQDFFEFWRRLDCPKCKATNWLYDSHSQRAYPYIPNGCKCHACQNRFFVGDQDEFSVRYGVEIEEYGLETTIEDYLDCQEGRDKPGGR